MSLSHLTRYRVYRSDKSRDFLCTVAATSRRDAVRIARDNGLRVERTGRAVEETPLATVLKQAAASEMFRMERGMA